MIRRLFVLMIVLLLAGCSAEQAQEKIQQSAEIAADIEATSIQDATAIAEEMMPTQTAVVTQEPPPHPTSLSTEAPLDDQTGLDIADEPDAALPNKEVVTFTATDGLDIVTTYATPGGEPPFPGVMLLHMLGSNRQVWETTAMVDALRLAGYAVLAVDMRGHGDTEGERDFETVGDDLAVVYEAFAQFDMVDAEKTAVMGGSIGANMALLLAVDFPEIDGAVLLSPGENYLGVSITDEIEDYGERPLLIIASEEDTYAASSSSKLAERAANSTLRMLSGVGHGTTMLVNQPDLSDEIVDWLNTHVAKGK